MNRRKFLRNAGQFAGLGVIAASLMNNSKTQAARSVKRIKVGQIGTAHAPYQDQSTKLRVSEEYIQGFIELVNTAYPSARLRPEDVCFIHCGLLPISSNRTSASSFNLLRQGRIFDHQVEDGIEGLITVVGVKYTTARHMAEKVLDLVLKKLKRETVSCQTHVKLIFGGEIERFNDFLTTGYVDRPNGVETWYIGHLIRTYGSEYRQVLRYMKEDHNSRSGGTELSKVMMAEVLYAILEEMAQRLSDVVLRRTDLGVAGKPAEGSLRSVAAVMAGELGWNKNKIEHEIEEVESIYTDFII